MKKAVLAGLLSEGTRPWPPGEPAPPLAVGLAPQRTFSLPPSRETPRSSVFPWDWRSPARKRLGAEVAIGHCYGIYRWAFPNETGYMQLNIGGGILPHFNFVDNKNLPVVDFYANLPVDIRVGRWFGRFMFYHVSSHPGDDHARTNPTLATDKNSRDSLRSIAPCDVGRLPAPL